MIRALLVDDEARGRGRLRRLLQDHPDVVVVGEATTGDEALREVLSLRPHVVFLDVQMPGKSGVEAAQAIAQHLPDGARPCVVFTTAHEQHAVAAFAVEATDYLLKPIDRDALARAMRRVRKAAWPADVPTPSTPPLPAPAPAPTASAEHLSGYRRGRIIPLHLDDIGLVQVVDTLTFAHVPEGRFRLRMAMHEVEGLLGPPRFFRVSRSAIVALDAVASLSPGESGTYTAVLRVPEGLEVSVSRRRARALRQLLG